MTGPLDGLLVADFSRVLAGPYATMLLADLGAEVVKVEGPPTGDDTRAWTPPERDGVSTYYLGVNRGKRSIVLDLREEADVALARELARRADVLIENFRPGGMAKFGLDFESVQRDNPGVVYASISGFGSGAGAELPGYDVVVQAMSGLMSITGSADGPGYRAGISVFDVMAGNHAVIGILAALRHRDATGAGPARRGQPALLGADRPGQPQLGLGRGRGGAVPDGQRPPERLPLRAVRDRRPRPDRHRRQRPAVPAAVRRARHPGGGRGRAVPPQRRPHQQPRRAEARSSRRRCRAGPPTSGSRCSPRPGSPAARSTPSTAGSRPPSGSASSPWSRWVRATGRSRRPGTRSASPARR